MENMTLMQAIEAENKARTSLLLVKKAVFEVVDAVDNLGADCSPSGMPCAIVPLDTVLHIRSLQMESYLSAEQSKLVRLRVASCNTASSLLTVLFGMVRDKQVDIGGKIYALNPCVVKALDAYLRAQTERGAEKQLG